MWAVRTIYKKCGFEPAAADSLVVVDTLDKKGIMVCVSPFHEKRLSIRINAWLDLRLYFFLRAVFHADYMPHIAA